MKAMDLKQRMGALTGEEKERYEQQFVPKLLKPEEADTIKEEEKAPKAENQGSESIESIQIKSEDLDGGESLQDKILEAVRWMKWKTALFPLSRRKRFRKKCFVIRLPRKNMKVYRSWSLKLAR